MGVCSRIYYIRQATYSGAPTHCPTSAQPNAQHDGTNEMIRGTHAARACTRRKQCHRREHQTPTHPSKPQGAGSIVEVELGELLLLLLLLLLAWT